MRYKPNGKYPTEKLKLFYLGKEKTPVNMTLQDIWNLEEKRLDSLDYYIQWLFPLDEADPFGIFGPVLSQEQISALKKEPLIKAHMIISFNHLLQNYGLLMDIASEQKLTIGYDSLFIEKYPIWIEEQNNQYRRVLRIIKSLNLFNLNGFADPFQKILQDIRSLKIQTNSDFP